MAGLRSQLLHRRGRAITSSTDDGAGAPQGRARWLPKLRRGAGGTEAARRIGCSGKIDVRENWGTELGDRRDVPRFPAERKLSKRPVCPRIPPVPAFLPAFLQRTVFSIRIKTYV